VGGDLKVGNFWLLKPYEAFGNRAEEIYFALLKCRRDGLRLVLIKRKINLGWKFAFRSANRALLDIDHPLVLNGVIFEVLNWFFSIFLALARVTGMGFRFLEGKLGVSWVGNSLVKLSDITVGHLGLWGEIAAPYQAANNRIDWKRCFDDKLGVTYRPRSFVDERFSLLRGRRYICLHVRDSGFFNDADFSENRNANIKNYLLGIEWLVDAGYVVVRLGDPSMPQIDVAGVFDYAHSALRSESCDIALVEHCDFYIGCQSGPIDLAALFEKRILTLNCYALACSFWYRNGSLFLPKQVVFNGRALTLGEQVRKNIFELNGTGKSVQGVEFIENSPEDIKAAIVEFIFFERLTDDQVQFNRFLKDRVFSYFESVPVWSSALADASQKYRWASRMGVTDGGVCDFYLKRNWS
jgi:putative glycosyltransferase (TIGR04372 family)